MDTRRRPAYALPFLAGALIISSCSSTADAPVDTAPRPARIAFLQEPAATVAGQPLGDPVVRVTLLDADGQVALGATDSVTLTLADHPEQAALRGATTRAASGGIVSFLGLSIEKAGPAYILLARSGNLPVAASRAFSVQSAVAARLQFQAPPPTTRAGKPIPVEVIVQDEFGNQVTNASDSLTISIASGPEWGSLTGITTVTADAGIARFTALQIDMAGAYALRVAAPALAAAVSPQFVVHAGNMVRLVFLSQPQDFLQATMAPAFSVAMTDYYGNVVQPGPNATVVVSLAGQPGHPYESEQELGSLWKNSSWRVTIPATGTATFSSLALDTAGTFRYIITAGGADSAMSDPFVIHPAYTSRPVQVAGAARFFSLGRGDADHLCALTAQGEAWCWGRNDAGQLGNGSTTAGDQPVRVSGNVRFASVHQGGDKSCGLTAAGEAWCWGAGATAPVRIGSGTAFAGLDVGAFICGVIASGSIQCGLASSDGSMSVGFQPELSSAGQSFVGVRTASNHTCGLTAAGAAWCQGGYWTGDTYTENPAQPESGQLSLIEVASERYHSCGVGIDGTGYCWGWNSGFPQIRGITGQLGNGTTITSWQPVAVAGGHRFTGITVSWAHSCGVTTSGEGWCWGRNHHGELGIGVTGNNSSVPVQVTGGVTFTAIQASSERNCGLATDGSVWCWGRIAW